MKRRIIIGITSLVLIGTTTGAIMENHSKPKSNAAEPVHKELTITQASVDAQMSPEPSPSEAPIATPKSTPKAQIQTVEAPVTYKWAAQMAAAGVAESDYGYVTQMLLDDNGWRTTGEKLWQGNSNAIVSGLNNDEATISFMLPRAIKWVNKYELTWAVAYDRWVNYGNF